MRYKVSFTKTMFVRGTKIIEAAGPAQALDQADALLHDPLRPLQTTDIDWGEPQYEEGSLKLDDSDPEEAP